MSKIEQGGGVLLFSRDPGAANQLAALHALARGDWRRDATSHDDQIVRLVAEIATASVVRVAVKDAAADIWARENAATQDWTGWALDACLAAFRDCAPRVLVTGTTDVDDRTDQSLWRAARELGAASIALVDHRINLAQRFYDPADGATGGMVWPDRVSVIDMASMEILAAAGANRTRLFVGGDLHLARTRVAGPDAGEVAALRRQWRAAPDDKVVLFASENAIEMAQAGRPARYNELERLSDLIARLRSDGDTRLLVIRPHPKDRPRKYDSFIADRADAPLRILVSRDADSLTAVRAADCVAGMRSALLSEAAALGVPIMLLPGAAA